MTEIKDIPEFEGLYGATSDGRIYSYRRQKFLKAVNGNKGYKQLCLHKDTKPYMRYLHRLVASAWIPNPDNLPEINHKDEDKSNNDISNLEWCTREYNLDCRTSIEKLKKPIYCVELDRVFESGKAVADCLGVDQASVSDCCRGALKSTHGYHFKFYKEGEER